MFSGSFGVRSIVLYKCSGKYIDIYFNLKIAYIIIPLFPMNFFQKYVVIKKLIVAVLQ